MRLRVAILVVLGLAALALGIIVAQSQAQTPSTTLLWTVPQGTAPNAIYLIRFSRNPVGADTASWWAGAVVAPNLPAPGPVGSTDSVQVSLSLWGQNYYFVERTCNGQMCSGFSNVAQFTTPSAPPSRLIDLRAR